MLHYNQHMNFKGENGTILVSFVSQFVLSVVSRCITVITLLNLCLDLQLTKVEMISMKNLMLHEGMLQFILGIYIFNPLNSGFPERRYSLTLNAHGGALSQHEFLTKYS